MSFKTENHRKLETFWARLQPHAWQRRSDWLFRGVDNAKHGLLPSALRNSSPTNEVLGEMSERQSHAQQIRAERRALRHFYAYADAQGLPVSAGSLNRSGAVDRQGDEARTETAWPPEALFPLCALAQHYRVPTRMLDWSRKPLVAAYFAASTDGKGEKIAVWALRHRDGERPLLDGFGVTVVSVPRFANTNLHLQSGKLTLHKYEGPTEKAPGLEKVLRRSGEHELIKLTLPVKLRVDLLKRLADHFVHAATIYSGYGGVALAVRERVMYRS
ncbi:MAG: FRG domain-containing protein [Polyangiaceae bacterium]